MLSSRGLLYASAMVSSVDTEDAGGDGAVVVGWLREAPYPVLFLTGCAGTGKSAVLARHVLPRLEREDGARVLVVPGTEDPATSLRTCLVESGDAGQDDDAACADLVGLLDRSVERLAGCRLLVVFEQCERFLNIQPKDPDVSAPLISLVRTSLARRAPSPTLLFVVRTDYLGQQPRELPDLVLNENWIELWGSARVGELPVRLSLQPSQKLLPEFLGSDVER